MKKLLLIITALLVTVGVFAQTSSDTWTVNKKDGTSENYKIVDNDGIKFTDENTFGNLMTDMESFGIIDTCKVSDVNSVTFSVYHEGDYSNVKLADASATTKTKKLYSYLQSIYGTKILSGIMANVSWNHDEADKVFKATGKYPAINCYDFIHIMSSAANSWINYDNITPVTEWSDANGIVSLMWHFNVPKTEADASASNYNDKVTCTPSETTFRATNVFTRGSWENKWFYGQMDKVCEVLLKLQDAGVVALWRPFHEAAGNATLKSGASWGRSWFWWGYDGADVYKKLWITMFNYFQQKGIHNLIWVWTSQNYNGDESQYDADSDWYPGDGYVDIIGRDLYGCDVSKQKTEFSQLQARYPGKMITLAECGTDAKTGTATADVQEAWSAGAKWSWFMPWYGGNMPTDSWWKNVVNEDAVITRDEVNQNSSYIEESAKDAVSNMGLGFNLGNTMDAVDMNKSMSKNSVTDFETCWGQPVTTNAMMKFLKDGGINAVRVPVTWFQHMDADGNVDKAWMDRVQQIVDYVINNGMYCVLNVHHDTGAESGGSSIHWIKADVQNHAANKSRFKSLWTQIATRFQDYGNKLVFEGYNEMLDASSTWNAPVDASSYTALNDYAQDFVDAVRATGGNNATRNLIVNTYAAANNDAVISNFKVPADKVSGHIAVEIHTYDPWNWFSSKGAWDSSCQTEITNMFTRLNNTFVSKGVPVVIGEYGTHGDNSVSKSSTDAEKQAAADQAADIVKKAKALGIATFYWMSIFQDADRTVPQWTLPIVVEAMNKAYNE